jgi:hypothetical protein
MNRGVLVWMRGVRSRSADRSSRIDGFASSAQVQPWCAGTGNDAVHVIAAIAAVRRTPPRNESVIHDIAGPPFPIKHQAWHHDRQRVDANTGKPSLIGARPFGRHRVLDDLSGIWARAFATPIGQLLAKQ